LFIIILINLKKNKTLLSYFLAHFSWHNQILKSVFQLIFHYTTKHRKIIHFPGIHFSKGNYFPANKWGLILSGKHFLEVVKNFKMSYYLLIISNLVLKLLIVIYILFWIFFFQFNPLKFYFYINFGPHFYNCYLLFPYNFLIEIFYLSNLVLILLTVIYFIWNNL